MERKWDGNMKAVRLALAAAVLAGCTVDDKTEGFFRDSAAPITSIALFDQAKFAGHWDMIASYSPEICALDLVVVNAAQVNLAEQSCLGSTRHSAAQITGPGRFTPKDGPSKGVEHWILWVDHAYRTAVIGTVTGEFGMILNRGQDIPADRLAAARDILDWNGYDLARLQMRP